jgi:aminopeptidase N
MENKGLNVFNTAYVLADPKTATDTDYARVEGVIGHEYFHNWTGNRVTCRDWFQLTLKEVMFKPISPMPHLQLRFSHVFNLLLLFILIRVSQFFGTRLVVMIRFTVLQYHFLIVPTLYLRDQEFSGDMGSRAVKRIEDVRALRGRQFAEDNSPMAHPIRPESYISMDNFYTATVYSKGAEVIRMYNTLLTKEGFRKGMDLYFQRHDGSAVTCDDFRAAMADANQVDLEQFALWYSTAGTPTVSYSSKFDEEAGTFYLTLTQSSNSELPLHIPVSVGLLDKASGEEVLPTVVLELKENTQTFPFPNLKGDVVPSILRGFSAPVKLVPESGEEDEDLLAFLAARDTDGFNKWEAGQKLYTSLIFQLLKGEASTKTLDFVMDAFGRTLTSPVNTDFSIQAYALTLPGESTLAELMDTIDPVGIRKAREHVKQRIARNFKKELMDRYSELTDVIRNEPFQVNAEAVGRRRLRNTCLEYLCSIYDTPEEQTWAANLAKTHFDDANCMTDTMAALSCLASMDGQGASARQYALDKFYQDANGNALVLDKWFLVQALADVEDVLDRVMQLTEHPDFSLENPNRCRSLLSAFTMNSAYFHDASGRGYRLLADQLERLDHINPQVAARMASSLIQFRRYDESRGALMKEQCQRLLNLSDISKDTMEILSRGMKDTK